VLFDCVVTPGLQPIYSPPVPVIPKVAAQDTSLTVSSVDGRETTFPVPSGTMIDIHVPGLHYNPRYWKESHRFIPERFLGDRPKDAAVQSRRPCLSGETVRTVAV